MADGVQSQVTSLDSPPTSYDPAEPVTSRRIKSLPKRRRTVAPPPPPPPQDTTPKYEFNLRRSLPADLAREIPDYNEEGHYVPISNGGAYGGEIDLRHVDFDGRPNGELFADGHNDADQGDGDYVDFIRRPNNTKKRKVPVAQSRRDDGALDEEELADDLLSPLPDRTCIEAVETTQPPWSAIARKTRLSRAARAALQHKELLKSRKRQLQTVLGAITTGHTFALDQALTSSYSLPKSSKARVGQAVKGPPVRLSRRPARRKARTLTLALSSGKKSSDHDENAGLPEHDFVFKCESATSERLRATKEEVAILHKHFRAELSRQRAKEGTRRPASTTAGQAQETKRDGHSQQRARVSTAAEGDTASSTPSKVPANTKTKSKKTKRSALANASNPHHLRNYVPSRLPHSGNTHSGSTASNTQNYLGPFPLRFLSAELPPRNAKKATATAPPALANLTNPEDEWMCPFCEYDLFYGDENSFRRAVRQRKKILARRRRAVERAAAAAAGRKKGVAPSEHSDSDGDDLEDGYADGAPEPNANTVPANAKPTKAKEQERDRDKEKGQGN